MDRDAHGLLTFFSMFYFPADSEIFRDFLDSRHPLALDGRRHATAASACLKIIFIYDQAPHSWHTPRINQCPQRHRADLKPKTLWHRNVRHWARRNHLYNYEQGAPPAFSELELKIKDQRFRSGLLTFLLEKSAYSDDLLNFACRRVFRFGYLQPNHPIIYEKGHFRSRKIHSQSHRGSSPSQDLRVDLGSSKVVYQELGVRFPIIPTPSGLTTRRVVIVLILAIVLVSSVVLSNII